MSKTVALLFLLPFLSLSQQQEQAVKYKGSRGGTVSLGVRSTVSIFNSHHDEGTGLGVGGQFRIQFADRVNSDWFFDYIKSDIGDFASRTDYHVGWSIIYYLTNPDLSTMKSDSYGEKTFPRLRPYILAGHCFDYTYMVSNFDRENYTERWSSAVQVGAGVHLNLNPRWDISFVGQYMMHLGNEVSGDIHNGVVEFHEEAGSSVEGHLLFHVGLNYKIADLW